MNALAYAINAFERAPAPDKITRMGIEFLVGSARKRLAGGAADADRRFAWEMAQRPIAEATDEANAQHFFTGGVMPSHGLIAQFPNLFELQDQWRWSGEHYRRTADHWLANFDANRTEIDAILKEVYGADAALWRRRWRLFFLSVSGLFGHQGGQEWGVSHYLLKPVQA